MTLVLSLFPGIGLLDMAFEEEGFCVVRGPDVIWGGDIRKFHPPIGKFDGVIGGPPCQSFSSLAHLVRANGYEPKFGNLIPEFERCINETLSSWFIMENVRGAPEPTIDGYDSFSFLLDNSHLAGENGFGQEQMRLRKITFGLRGRKAPDLRRWIDLATFFLPDVHEAVTGGHDKPPSARIGNSRKQYRQGSVTSSDGGRSVRMRRYRLPDACRLQGLPENFLADAPFTSEGKLKAVANGVPIPMGRAIAKAVKKATEEML